MIGWEDVYKVVAAMAPLYVALMFGYCSVKWWRLFVTPEQCDAINRLVCYFTLPLFAFEFTAHVDPFDMNYMFMAADVISKLLIFLVMACWYGSSKFTAAGAGKLHDGKEVKHDNFGWSITIFSLSNLTNSLVVGVPLLRAMYGQMAVDLVVQSSVFQALIWLTLLLFVLEVRRSCGSKDSIQFNPDVSNAAVPSENINSNNTKDVNALNCDLEDPTTNRISSTDTTAGEVRESININGRLSNFWTLTKVVWLKLAMNPNSYACIIGIAWAFLSNRWHMEMPSIMEGSVLIMSRAGTGTAMFSMGLFMASQEKVIACGASLTVFGMVLRFIAGPLAMAIASLAVGLHGDVLRVAIIQAALPQSITSFIYAKEYGLHPDVLSSAVIFGMIVSLPVLVGYYAVLEFVH